MTLVGYFVRLKLRILRNSFSKDSSVRVGVVLFAIAALAGGSISARVFFRMSLGTASGTTTLIAGFCLVFATWVFGPILVGGIDDALDPANLLTLPLKPSQRRSGLLAASLVGFLPLGAAIALSGVVLGELGRFTNQSWRGADGSFAQLVVTFLAVATLFALSAFANRLVAVALAMGARSRRGKDLTVIAASLCASCIWLLTQSLRFLQPRDLSRVLNVLRWTPPGGLAQAIVDWHQGNGWKATARIVLVAGVTVGAAQLWTRWLEDVLTDSAPRSTNGTRRRATFLVGWPRRWRSRPGLAVFHKEMLYLARSPQRRSSLIVGVCVGAPFAFIQSLGFTQLPFHSVYVAGFAMLFGLGVSNNLLGGEAASLWLELTSGVPIRTLLLARSVASLPYLLLPVVSGAGLIAAVGGDWERFGIVGALAFSCWGIPLGVGAVISVLTPFPQTDGSPFSNQRPAVGQGCLVTFMGFFSLCVVAALFVPIVVALSANSEDLKLIRILIIAFAGVYSCVIWQVGLTIATRRTNRMQYGWIEEFTARRTSV